MKMHRLLLSVVLVASMLLGVVHVAHAKTYTHPAGFSFDLPNDWNVNKQPKSITGESPSKSSAVNFTVAPAGANLKIISDAYGQEVRKMLKKVQTDKPISTKIHGMPTMFVDGIGVLDGTPVNFTYGVYAKGDRYLAVFLMCEKTKFKQEKDALVSILTSVKPK